MKPCLTPKLASQPPTSDATDQSSQFLGVLKCWGKIGEFTIQEAKFDKEFPHLFGENKNQIEEKLDFSRRQINLSSRQAPAATAQTPASTLCQPSHLPAKPPPPSQPPASPLPARAQPAICLPAHPAPSVPAASPHPACLPPASLPAASQAPASHLLAHPAASVPAPSVMVGSIMPGIVCPSKKAQKAGNPVSKLTELTDLNQMVDQKWVTAAPVCQLKPAPLLN
ncbi:hypothetical protein DSO57_1005102 [Entomophthora muscae]|uniref:Uncharacterized protein n=1 Tax=Entomophthora muscae TaxID=34485 RepID=A0ACC2SA17_9FUNG|nr:hypothetical protein DSO57_1005102 [Entomophthora muscae]